MPSPFIRPSSLLTLFLIGAQQVNNLLKLICIIVNASPSSRQPFLARAMATGFLIPPSSMMHGSLANSKIRLGVVGCGGRGWGMTEQFVAYGGYEIAAAADAFQDKLNVFGEHYHVSRAKHFVGLDTHKQMLASGVVDAICGFWPAKHL